jgi:hypothetical protein
MSRQMHSHSVLEKNELDLRVSAQFVVAEPCTDTPVVKELGSDRRKRNSKQANDERRTAEEHGMIVDQFRDPFNSLTIY